MYGIERGLGSFVRQETWAHSCSDINKSTGPFSVPTALLKLFKTCLLKTLETLFNLSFSHGKVPSKFKIARVIPVYKKGSMSRVSNYRPISLLSIFNRLLEKLMYNRLIFYFNKIDVLSDNQFGFRKNHSTFHPLILIVDKIQRAMEEGNYSCGILLTLVRHLTQWIIISY